MSRVGDGSKKWMILGPLFGVLFAIGGVAFVYRKRICRSVNNARRKRDRDGGSRKRGIRSSGGGTQDIIDASGRGGHARFFLNSDYSSLIHF